MGAACDRLGVLGWEEEFSGELSLQNEEFPSFLTTVLLLVELLVALALKVADESDDALFSLIFLLFLFFVVGSIGSHLTRAAFVERLVSVLEFRLWSRTRTLESCIIRKVILYIYSTNKTHIQQFSSCHTQETTIANLTKHNHKLQFVCVYYTMLIVKQG